MAYDSTNLDPATESGRVNIVYFYLGGSEVEDVLSEGEITFLLSQTNGNTLLAASLGAYSLGSKYASWVNTELEGVLQEDYSDLSEKYYKLASSLKDQAKLSSLGVSFPAGVSSGTTAPEFTIDQFEYPTDEPS